MNAHAHPAHKSPGGLQHRKTGHPQPDNSVRWASSVLNSWGPGATARWLQPRPCPAVLEPGEAWSCVRGPFSRRIPPELQQPGAFLDASSAGPSRLPFLTTRSNGPSGRGSQGRVQRLRRRRPRTTRPFEAPRRDRERGIPRGPANRRLRNRRCLPGLPGRPGAA